MLSPCLVSVRSPKFLSVGTFDVGDEFGTTGGGGSHSVIIYFVIKIRIR